MISSPRRASRLGTLALGTALAAAGASLPSAPASAAEDGPLLSYVVNTKPNSSHTRAAAEAVVANGGTVVETYRKIGVVIARSSDPEFADNLRARGPKGDIWSVGQTRTAGIEASVDDATAVASAGRRTARATASAVTPDPLESRQWDLPLIKATQAQEINPGSKRVVVGILDDGIDDTHQDLAAQVDDSLSTDCLSGKPDSSVGSWRPASPTADYHGTHVAGTVAAARNGVGVVGVAPGVTLAAVKVVNPDGLIYPEAAICGFMWAAQHDFDVTNNSYYVDPWLFWCRGDEDQAAVQDAVLKAIAYATEQDVFNVAAAGNENYDLANKTTDATSPDDSTPVTRPVDAECLSLPTEAPGVVQVASVTQAKAKSGFSNYGYGKIDVAAPGSSILSTFPGDRYGTISGTSMASPHVAGVAALLKSTHPKADPAQLLQLLRAQADPLPCPTTGAAAAQCTGTTAYNSLFGYGLVDALDAVS
ncbi:S8 family peptidase [Motilibacter aurantiacus]|uniref:S8 family peptidase n=1 Tax=Motilibacter aurantiacus TaxID=2714955 RepID=UPI00140DDAAA|nr:S8 family serine peptidase [Motilibacter aurantiacus]NHC45756.1 S8 family serine peptidase [Motilibacter aurantiacus]